MARFKEHVQIEVCIEVVLSESEARALDALSGYGVDAFVAAFYDKLGEAYMRKHEAGLRDFLRTVRSQIPKILSKVDRAHAAFEEEK